MHKKRYFHISVVGCVSDVHDDGISILLLFFYAFPIIGNGFSVFFVCLTFGINTSSVWNFHLNWIFSSTFYFFIIACFIPQLNKKERKQLLLMFVILKAPFCSPSFTFLFLYYFFSNGMMFQMGVASLFPLFYSVAPKKLNRGMFRSKRQKKILPLISLNTPAGTRNKKTLFYFIIDWIFLSFWQKTNIYFVVNRAVSLVCFRCCPLSFDNGWPILDDAFSAL